MRFAVMAARAVGRARDACRSVVEPRQDEIEVRSAMTYDAVLAHRRQRHVCHRHTGGCRSVMTGFAGRIRRRVYPRPRGNQTRMVKFRA